MKEQLIHILDQSVCLSRKQMREYLNGTMQQEEMHAAEIHLNTCPLCSMAMEGFEAHSEEALAAIASLNSGFLKDHFDNIAPQIHLNSMAPAATLPTAHPSQKRGHIQPLWRTASIAAAVLLSFGVLWYIEFGRNKGAASAPLAMANDSQAKPEIERTPMSDAPSRPAAAMTTATEKEAISKPTESRKRTSSTEVSGNTSSRDSHTSNQVIESRAKVAPRSAGAAPDEFALSSKTPPQDVVVRANRADQAPLIDPGKPGGSMVKTADQIEKSAAHSSDIASLSTQKSQSGSDGISIGGGRSTGTKYVIDGVKQKPIAAEKAEKGEQSLMTLGDESYEKGKFSTALAHYTRQMNMGDSRTRYQATIRAAHCYASLGNKAKAEQLLRSVINDGAGPERRAAHRMLRSLE